MQVNINFLVVNKTIIDYCTDLINPKASLSQWNLVIIGLSAELTMGVLLIIIE